MSIACISLRPDRYGPGRVELHRSPELQIECVRDGWTVSARVEVAPGESTHAHRQPGLPPEPEGPSEWEVGLVQNFTGWSIRYETVPRGEAGGQQFSGHLEQARRYLDVDSHFDDIHLRQAGHPGGPPPAVEGPLAIELIDRQLAQTGLEPIGSPHGG